MPKMCENGAYTYVQNQIFTLGKSAEFTESLDFCVLVKKRILFLTFYLDNQTSTQKNWCLEIKKIS